MGVRPMGHGKSAMWMAGLGGPPNGGHRGLAPAGGIVHAGCAPHFLFETSKRKCAAPGGKEKMSRRVGLRRRRPPAAGGGRLAIPRGGQRRKRPALGEPFSPGMSGIHRCADFRCRWPVVDESLRSGPMKASASTTARAARSEAERAEREAGQMRSCTPTTSAPSATGRQYRPHRRPKRARRPGKIGAGTGTPTPVRAEGHCTGARPAPFSLTPGAARSLFGATKKRMGGALPSWHPS